MSTFRRIATESRHLGGWYLEIVRGGGISAGWIARVFWAALAIALLFAPAATAAPPANDDFDDAEALTGFPTSATGTLTQATLETGEPDHGESTVKSIWFEWTAPTSVPVRIDTCDTFIFGNALAVYRGDSLTTLSRVRGYETSFGPSCNGHPSLSFNPVQGAEYMIAIGGWNGSGGAVGLQINEAESPANDDFDHPYAFTGEGQIAAEGTNAGATKEPGEPNHEGDPGGSSVWFEWTAPGSGVATISACLTEFPVAIAAYEGDSLDRLEPIGRRGVLPDCGAGEGYLRFGVTAGHAYRFALDGATQGGTEPAAVGEYFIEAFVGPGNYPQDNFANAMPFGSSSGEGTLEGDTSWATREVGEPRHAGRRGVASHWFQWTPRYSGRMILDACSSAFDSLLAVYTGDSLEGLSPVTANDDSVGPRCAGSRGSELAFDAVAGTLYWVALDSAGPETGAYTLEWRQQIVLPRGRARPNTKIRRVRLRRKNRAASIGFFGVGDFDRFRCKLDQRRFQRCRSPQAYSRLRPGRHRFAVYAIDETGRRDLTPAVVHFWIKPDRGTRRR